MKDMCDTAQITGEEIIVTAGTLAITLAQCMDNKEIESFCELIGLLKHQLEIIKIRRFLKKIEEKKS